VIFDLKRLRNQWREMNARVEQLERKLKETDEIVDALLSDAEYRPNQDLGMNGQRRGKEFVQQLFERLGLEQIVETGTYLDATTGCFATPFRVPVYSSELMPRDHYFARRWLRNLSNVDLHLQDSRSFLKVLAENTEASQRRTFFYLDAH
jgi:hypothetical protein